MLRVAGVCINGGHVLLQGSAQTSFWVLPGGRCEMQEPTQQTLQREMREEIECDITVERLLWVVENFFVHREYAFHEIGLYYAMSLQQVPTHLGLERTYHTDDGGPIHFRWFPLDRLGEVELHPAFLRQGLLALPLAPVHVVQRDP